MLARSTNRRARRDPVVRWVSNRHPQHSQHPAGHWRGSPGRAGPAWWRAERVVSSGLWRHGRPFRVKSVGIRVTCGAASLAREYDAGDNENGKPAARRGRKATGPTRSARLPKVRDVIMSPTQRLESRSILPGSRCDARATRGISLRGGPTTACVRGEDPSWAVHKPVLRRNTPRRHGAPSMSTVAGPAAAPVEVFGSGSARRLLRLGHGRAASCGHEIEAIVRR